MKASELNAGDWFEFHGKRYLCLDPRCTRSSSVVCWSPQSGSSYISPKSTVTPIPDCTGWDWEPGPNVWYRNEYRMGSGGWLTTKEECDEHVNAVDRIGHTIRRVWTDGRIEQEFVQEQGQ